MTAFKFFQIFALSYTGLVTLLLILLIAVGPYVFFGTLSRKVHGNGKNLVFIPFCILSALFTFSWLALAIPLIDVSIGTEWFTKLHDGMFITWFGSFPADTYYINIALSGVVTALIGAFFIKRFFDKLVPISVEQWHYEND